MDYQGISSKRDENLRGFYPELESAAHVEGWVGDRQGSSNMLILKMRGKEKSIFIHLVRRIRSFQHSVA